jgi:hypothetical protein
MWANKTLGIPGAALVALFLSALLPATGQGMQYVIHSETRVFPAIGPGVTALKRDAAGNYYILAAPASTIFVFNSAGHPKGQIPNVNSHGATIRYAISIDLDPQGRLYVADRGDNAIKIFAPDGALVANVPVAAPTSVVALPGGQFAVTKLQSKRLVQIMDQSGATIRTFGDPGDMGANTPASRPAPASSPAAHSVPIVDRGRITGDSTGNIYFAFTSLTDPALQRFDRYGYSAYDSVMPAIDFGALGGRTGRDVEFGYTMSGVTGPDSVTAWTDLHSVKASVGRSGGRPGRGGSGSDTNGTGLGSTGAANSSDLSTADSGTSAIAGDTSDFDGEVLSYDAQDASSNSDSPLSGTSGLGLLGPGFATPGLGGMGFGDPFRGGFHGGSFGGFGGGEGARPDFFGSRPDGGDGFGHFHPGGFGTYRASATLRVALDPSKRNLPNPVITAVGVDPQTQEAWVAIGDMLVHLDGNGNPVDTYYVTISGEATMKASAILVEPNRILIASDSWGIYAFPRPDKTSLAPTPAQSSAPAPRSTVVAQPLTPVQK